MRAIVLLRISLVLEWGFLAASIVADALFEPTLPEALRSWEDESNSADLPPHQIALLLTIIPLLLASFVGTVGLFFRQRWAAWVYLISLVNAHLLTAFLGPTVSTGPGGALEAAGFLCSGFSIGLAFFSDALKPDPPMTR
jgi:hypothetical protein